jgi:hypothetical protein
MFEGDCQHYELTHTHTHYDTYAHHTLALLLYY